MKKLMIFGLFAFVFTAANAQQSAEKEEVIKVVNQLFDGMRAKDSSMVRQVFLPDATMLTSLVDKDGKPQLHKGDLNGFIGFIGTPSDNKYDERLYGYDVQIDGTLATVWSEYSFFLNDKLSHCGVDAFMLHKTADGWKIFNVTDTRRKTACKTE